MRGPGPSRDTVLCRHILYSNGRGNSALDRGWECFQTQILAFLCWHFLSWLKSDFFFPLFKHTHTKQKKYIAWPRDEVQYEIT